MRPIVFDDEHIRVIAQDENVARVIVIFNETGQAANGDRFWGDVFLAKSGLAGIGVMSKQPNWFRSQSMDKALPAMQRVVAGMPTLSTVQAFWFCRTALKIAE